jgi:hypothetical protein
LYNTASDGGGVTADVNSTVVLSGGSVSSNTATTSVGGGVDNLGQLTVLSADISHNQAEDSSNGNGGGIYSLGPVVIEGGNINDNSGHYGGGINSQGGLTLTTSTVANNTATDGGGLYFGGGGGYIDQSTISGNAGGGVEAGGDFFDHVEIDDSTINSNTNTYDGAGITNRVHLYMVNDTVSDNQTQGSGGGIYNSNGVIVELDNVTIAHNTADSEHDGTGDSGGLYNELGREVQFYNTLIAGNIDTGGQSPDCGGELTSQDYNLVQSTLGCTITGTTTHNITGKNPLLGPLQNNGGSTWTRALLPGSPAIDAGTPSTIDWECAIKDQRGVTRPIGSRCDIGAYEAPIFLHVFLPLVKR